MSPAKPCCNCGLDISHRAPQAEHCDGNERTPPVHARSIGRTRRGPERSSTVVSRKLDTDLLPKDCDAGGLYLSAETDRERAQTVEVAERTAKLARAFPNENLVAVLMWPRMRAYLRDAEHRQPSCRRRRLVAVPPSQPIVRARPPAGELGASRMMPSDREAVRAGAARGLAEVLRARRPDLSWHVVDPLDTDRRRGLALNAEAANGAGGENPDAIIEPAAPANPDDRQRAA